MKQLLTTLYVTSKECQIKLNNAGIVIQKADGEKQRVAGHTIDSIVIFGNSTITSQMVRWCGQNNVRIIYLTDGGSFCGRIQGETQGNIMLRLDQFRNVISDNSLRMEISKGILRGKLNNSRIVLQHAARDASPERRARLSDAAVKIHKVEDTIKAVEDPAILRGWEGTAGNIYFSVFNDMIKSDEPEMQFNGRNRRPPKDCVNSLLSFLYTLLAHDVQNALESIGLDPECGYFHTLRSGKPALALDLMEEFRAPVCDRLVLALINRKQITSRDFLKQDGAILLTDQARKLVLKSLHSKKEEQIFHPIYDDHIPLGLLPFAQAQLLARAIRQQIENYPPFMWH